MNQSLPATGMSQPAPPASFNAVVLSVLPLARSTAVSRSVPFTLFSLSAQTAPPAIAIVRFLRS